MQIDPKHLSTGAKHVAAPWLLCRARAVATVLILMSGFVCFALPQCLAAQNIANNENSQHRPKEILILYSMRDQTPVNADWTRGIRSELKEGYADPVTIYVEYLDLLRFNDADHNELWISLLKQKYADRNIEVVIPVNRMALQFARTHRTELFPNASIVFCAVDYDAAASLVDSQTMSGVYGRFEVAKTLDLALQLLPETKGAVVIADNSPFGQSALQTARRQLQSRKDQINIEYWQDATIEQLYERARVLSPDHIIIFLPFLRDANGRDFFPVDVLESFTVESSVPVFGCWDTLLGRGGVVGGHMMRIEEQGRAVGSIVARVLNGEDVSAIPPTGLELSDPMVDWPQLNRWNIPTSRIPPATIIVNRTPSVWKRYWAAIVATIAVIAIQSLLLAALVISRVHQGRTEATLAATREQSLHHRDELARVARALSLGELTTSIAHEVKQPLFAIVSNAQTALRFLNRPEPDMEEAREALTDIVSDGNRASEIIDHIRALVKKEKKPVETIDLNRIAGDVIRLVEPDICQRGQSIRIAFADGLPLVQGSATELQQVILNFIVNGVQAMDGVDADHREIVVTTSTNNGTVELAVRDSGAGLDDDKAKLVFEPLYTTKQQGTGMGLAINRTIIEAHGGNIWVTSNDDRGATFRFSLPIAKDVAS